MNTERKTKVVCTMGPASYGLVKELIEAGMGVARINCTHESIEGIGRVTADVRKFSKELGTDVAVMLDTKGPDVRIGRFEGGSVIVEEGSKFTLYLNPAKKDVLGTKDGVFVNCEHLAEKVKAGQELRLNDGMVIMTVESASADTVIARVEIGGQLKDRKSLAVPGCDLGLQFISAADEADITKGVEVGVDWIAASFVSSARDVADMRALLKKLGGEKIKIVSKIESLFGIRNMDEIIAASDGIMVARGDMGVEIPVEEVPVVQKVLIKKTREAKKIIITATEMMESMMEKPRPTRAEVSDVANAVWDGTEYIMLSGECAAGKYPVRCVGYMCRVAAYAEKYKEYYRV